MKILITGSNGQLGKCINFHRSDFPKLDLLFVTKEEFDITSKQCIDSFLSNQKIDYLINCAAFTDVEQSEKEPDKAFLVNSEGVKNLAEVCKKHNSTLIHISTDYVFDGSKNTSYTEEDKPNPINEYGKSKLKGEQYIQEILKKYFIVRTSWLYSQFGHNFFKTIIKKSETENQLRIVTSETGTPTNANDLAQFILYLVERNDQKYGIYHFSNLGEATWFDFAKEIVKNLGKLDIIKLEKTDNYPTFAERPKYSIISKEKCLKSLDLSILDWKESLKKLMLE